VHVKRLVGGTLESLILVAIAALALVVPGAAGASCEMTVDPATAIAGSVFTLHGSGFTPTELMLQREGGTASTIPLDLGTADPFDIPIGSKQTDVGTWHATANEPGVCSASTSFVATLASTDTTVAPGATPGGADDRLPLGVYAVVIGVGLAGGALAARHLQSRLATRRIRR
jgi:hypothetical protein